MHKSVGYFWLALAMLYLVLAAVSYHYGEVYDQKLAKAPTMQGTAEGAARFETSVGTVVLGGSSGGSQPSDDAGGGGDAVVVDLWKDLRAYLNASMWVNLAGFGLAAAAAIVSFFLSSRSEALRA